MPTIKDIAKAARVSPSTVSRVLNNRGWVSDENTRRVLEAVRELDFRPNAMAQGLRTGVKGLLGVLIANPYGTLYDDAYFNRVIRGFGHVAEENGFSLVLSSIHDEKVPSMITRNFIDGVMVAGHIVSPKLISELKSLGLKMIILGKHALDIKVPRMIIDNAQGVFNGVQYLLAKGHQRIGIVIGPAELYSTQDRLLGYQTALAAAGIPVQKEYIAIQSAEKDQPPGYRGVQQLMSLPDPPTAIIAGDNWVLFGAYQCCLEYQLQHQRDIELLGWGEIENVERTGFNYTAVKVHDYEVGTKLCRMLVDLVLNNAELSEETVVPEIVMKSK